MSIYFPTNGTAVKADKVAVAASSAQFAGIAAMANNEVYVLCADCDICWMQSANPTAVDAATSSYLPAKQPVFIKGDNGAKLAVIGHASATGFAFLNRVSL